MCDAIRAFYTCAQVCVCVAERFDFIHSHSESCVHVRFDRFSFVLAFVVITSNTKSYALLSRRDSDTFYYILFLILIFVRG